MTASGLNSLRRVIIMVTALGFAAEGAAAETTSSVSASLEESAGYMGAQVHLSGYVDNPVKGHDYALYYQVRVHSKKGELGPVLGTKDSPNGKAVFVIQYKCDQSFLSFGQRVDVTRGALSGMTNFKCWRLTKGGYNPMLLRVEAHVYDVTEKKYLKRTQPSAAILIADVDGDGKVARLQPLADLLRQAGSEGRNPAEALAMLADLDAFNTLDNGIEDAFAAVLVSRTATAETKLAFLKAMPMKNVGGKKVAYHLDMAIDKLANGDDPKLKAAAQKVFDDAKEK